MTGLPNTIPSRILARPASQLYNLLLDRYGDDRPVHFLLISDGGPEPVFTVSESDDLFAGWTAPAAAAMAGVSTEDLRPQRIFTFVGGSREMPATVIAMGAAGIVKSFRYVGQRRFVGFDVFTEELES